MDWNFDNIDEEAQSSQNRGKKWIDGRYGMRLEDIEETKTFNTNMPKFVAKWKVVDSDDKEKLAELAGVTKNQHFVVGHAKPDVAANYRKDFLGLIRRVIGSLEWVKDEGDLYKARKKAIEAHPIVWFDLSLQDGSDKYLNWDYVPETESGEAGESPAPNADPSKAEEDGLFKQ